MIFNTEMVKALLSGRKTVTRELRQLGANNGIEYLLSQIPYKVDDLIWVRETFATLHCGDYKEITPQETSCQEVRYKASEPAALAFEPDHEIRGYKWRPSIHMPKHCSRLTLRIIDVWIERVQEITEQEAVSEGSPLPGFGRCQKPVAWFSSLEYKN